jgi:metal-dependent amidase/aminoacylase/carboxypeptidase family protein
VIRARKTGQNETRNGPEQARRAKKHIRNNIGLKSEVSPQPLKSGSDDFGSLKKIRKWLL